MKPIPAEKLPRNFAVFDLSRDFYDNNDNQFRQKFWFYALRMRALWEEELIQPVEDIWDLGQIFSALKMILAHHEHLADSRNAKKEDLLLKVESLIDSGIRSVRSIATTLRPDILDLLGLIEAIEWEVRLFNRSFDFDLKLKTCREHIDLSPAQAGKIFRYFQQVLIFITSYPAKSGLLSIGADVDRLEFKISIKHEPNTSVYHFQNYELTKLKDQAIALGGILDVLTYKNFTLLKVFLPSGY